MGAIRIRSSTESQPIQGTHTQRPDEIKKSKSMVHLIKELSWSKKQ